MLFFHRVVHMWGQPPARGAEGRCRAAAGLWTTRSGPAVGEEVHSLCVHALPQAVTGVGKQVFHRPRGPVGAGIPPVDQDLPHVPNPVDNQGREGWLSTGGCGQLRGGTGEGAWGQSWGQSGDNLGGPGSAPRRGGGMSRELTARGWALVPHRAGARWLTLGRGRPGPGSAPRRGAAVRYAGVGRRRGRVARGRTSGSVPAAGRARGSGSRPYGRVLIPAWACAARSGSRPYGRLARAVRPGGPSGPRPYVFRFSPRSRRRRLTTPAGSPYCSEDVRAESRPTPRGSRGSDRAAKPRAARLPIFRPGVHP